MLPIRCTSLGRSHKRVRSHRPTGAPPRKSETTSELEGSRDVEADPPQITPLRSTMRAVRGPFVSPTFTVAYVPAHLPSYEALQHDVFDRSRRVLTQRVEAAGGAMAEKLAPIETREQAERVAERLAATGTDLVVLQSASFAMGDMVLPFADRGLRLCLWAPEEPRRSGPIPLNGFVSMHLQAGVLRRWARTPGAPFKWLFGDEGHPWFEDRLAVTLRAVRGLAALEGARIGLVGGVAPTFLNVVADARNLHQRLHVEVVDRELSEVIATSDGLLANASSTELTTVTTELETAADGRVEVSSEDLRANAAVYIALRRLAREHELDALAVSDWPLFQGRMGLHPGLAFSWLDQHDGVPVASEGDVGGALGMLLARGIAAEPAMLLDVNDVDMDRDALLTWHCGGSPLAIADDDGVRWTRHTTLSRDPDAPMGTVADLRFRHGPVTLLRVSDHGARMFVVDGDVIASPHPGFDGSRGWVSGFLDAVGAVSAGDVVQTLLHEGIEHHLTLVPGRHAVAVREAAAWLGAELVETCRYRDELAPYSRSRS